MGNRPINRRPWRKKPWGKKRPTRWNATTGGSVADSCLSNNTTLACTGDDAIQPVVVICEGQVDVEPWADDQEVTIDRIVGDVTFYGYYIQPASGANAFSNHTPLIKMGVLLDQELSNDGFSFEIPQHDLWEQEILEDLPWMYLKTFLPRSFVQIAPQGVSAGLTHFTETVHLDIGVRRKIGQRDALNLYASWRSPASDFNVQVLCYADLRCILMSR